MKIEKKWKLTLVFFFTMFVYIDVGSSTLFYVVVAVSSILLPPFKKGNILESAFMALCLTALFSYLVPWLVDNGYVFKTEEKTEVLLGIYITLFVSAVIALAAISNISKKMKKKDVRNI